MGQLGGRIYAGLFNTIVRNDLGEYRTQVYKAGADTNSRVTKDMKTAERQILSGTPAKVGSGTVVQSRIRENGDASHCQKFYVARWTPEL